MLPFRRVDAYILRKRIFGKNVETKPRVFIRRKGFSEEAGRDRMKKYAQYKRYFMPVVRI